MDDKGAYGLFLTGNLEVELHKSVEEAARLMRLGQGAAMWPAALGFLKPDHGSFGRLRIRISH
ncbi:hypothetical protein [Brucella anthropi]|uniref:hypothetical protein n=1 Tax=Brucella anthropi TaxID=529 RepID=UPI0005B85394|nr:hypothetical protein [Brucella anthropi]KIU69584.1 hypothetical protein TR92_05075 [Brucella anthropi]